MAEGEQQQQPQQQQRQQQPQPQERKQQPAFNLLEAQPYLIAMDDYIYEAKPPPKPFEDIEGTDTGSGGMSSQFSNVSSALNKNI